MERLTGRYTPELVYLIGNGQTYNTRSRSKMAKALDRLASYEDTGLTPEEAKYFGRLIRGERMVTEEDLVESGVSQEEIQRMKDVITAEAEGRLLVLPCKVGPHGRLIDADALIRRLNIRLDELEGRT